MTYLVNWNCEVNFREFRREMGKGRVELFPGFSR